MPWEVDYLLLMALQLKKAKQHVPEGINICLDLELNLTRYLFDWNKSLIPKEYFIDKFNTIQLLLKDYEVRSFVYEGEEKHGHLDQQKRIISPETDYYGAICPDIYFNETLLGYMVEAAKQVTNKYAVLTPQVSKVGDADWDRIVDPKCMSIPYSEYLDVDAIKLCQNAADQEKYLEPLQKTKFAGWFDLYSKAFYEELCPVQHEWTGYGPWDHYSMILADYCKEQGLDVQQYLLRGETVWMYPSGPLLENGSDGFTKYYRDNLSIKEVPSQRKEFESKFREYLEKGLADLKVKGLLK